MNWLAMSSNVDAMDSNGLRAIQLSSYTEIDAGDELRKPLKPLLAIACVVCRFYSIFSIRLNHILYFLLVQ